mmetsp:Transcript_37751/g.76817  ORF Transcript_37751/g.76817 Transcript_37751/m.76817 type:complete len:176 (-) Transcript_37751:53-580(-)
MDYNLDESYTPKRISIKVGMTFHDLEEVKCVDLNEPNGWCSIPLYKLPGDDPLDDIDEEDVDGADKNDGYDPLAGPLSGKRMPLRTHFIQVSVVSMHQNGRDTHCRMVKIFGPRKEGHLVDRSMMTAEASAPGPNSSRNGGTGGKGSSGGVQGGWATRTLPKFTTASMDQFSTIR